MRQIYVDGSTRQTCTVIDGVAGVLPIKLGEKVTNNQGEYYAVLAGLKRAKDLGLQEVEVLTDSQLVVRQLNGEYSTRNTKLWGLGYIVKRLASYFTKVKFTWIPREENPAGEVLG